MSQIVNASITVQIDAPGTYVINVTLAEAAPAPRVVVGAPPSKTDVSALPPAK